MPNKIRDKVTVSDEAKVAEMIRDYYSSLELDRISTSQLAQKIVAMLDERDISGWVSFKTLSGLCKWRCGGYCSEASVQDRDVIDCTEERCPAKQHEVNSGLAAKEEG